MSIFAVGNHAGDTIIAINMKRILISLCPAIVALFVLSSCATLFGGSHYVAKVTVPSHPDAVIAVNGAIKGKGEVNVDVKRRDADKLSIQIEEPGCEPELFSFYNKTFRGWTFAGSLLFLTGAIGSIPIPWGILVDGISGAWWKPDINERYVSRQGYDHYTYTLPYKAVPLTSIEQEPAELKQESNDKVKLLRELKALLDDGILTIEEFEKEKAKILNGDN